MTNAGSTIVVYVDRKPNSKRHIDKLTLWIYIDLLIWCDQFDHWGDSWLPKDTIKEIETIKSLL